MMDIIQLIVQTGFAVGVATYLIYWLTNHLKTRLDEIKQKQAIMVEKQTIIIELLKDIKEEIRKLKEK